MSKLFWQVGCACWSFVAAGPWEMPSRAHSWWDALFWAAAVFCGLRAIQTERADP